MARKSKMTPEVQQSIIESIKNGLTFKNAAQVAGIDETTLHRWRRKGEQDGSGVYRQFMDAIKGAQLQTKLIHLQNIGNCGAGGQIEETVSEHRDTNGNIVRRTILKKEVFPEWRASAWILERRFPGEFGKRAQQRPDEHHDPVLERLGALKKAESE